MLQYKLVITLHNHQGVIKLAADKKKIYLALSATTPVIYWDYLIESTTISIIKLKIKGDWANFAGCYDMIYLDRLRDKSIHNNTSCYLFDMEKNLIGEELNFTNYYLLCISGKKWTVKVYGKYVFYYKHCAGITFLINLWYWINLTD